MFQTAQLAAAQMELAGEKDDFTALVAAEGNGGHITEPLTDTMTQEECDALNARVCALYFDKGAEPEENTPEGKLYAYIKDYVYDSSFLDAAFCIEIDASTGQNAISQAKLFHEAVGLTGIPLTKLDGTAKGGIVIAIARELGVPVKFAGVGEGIDDLKPFDAGDYVKAII